MQTESEKKYIFLVCKYNQLYKTHPDSFLRSTSKPDIQTPALVNQSQDLEDCVSTDVIYYQNKDLVKSEFNFTLFS